MSTLKSNKQTKRTTTQNNPTSANQHVRVQTAEGRKRAQKRERLEMRKREWSDPEKQA